MAAFAYWDKLWETVCDKVWYLGGMANDPALTAVSAEFQARLERFLSSLPSDWRVSSVRPEDRDWVVSLTDAAGIAMSQIVLLGERSAEETHGAQPRW